MTTLFGIGLLLLVVLWVNAVLIAVAAWMDLRDIQARAASWTLLEDGTEGEGLIFVRVRSAEQEGALAVQSIEQSGHAMQTKASHRRIGWWDRLHRSFIAGGELSWGDVVIHVPPYEAPVADVWPLRSEQEESAERFSMSELEGLYEKAAKPRGVRRTLHFSTQPGQEVWVAGRVVRSEKGWTLLPDQYQKVLVSSIDPRVWLERKKRLAWFFIVGELTICALCTLMCLYPPVFTSWLSKLGAVAFLAYFLGVQPLGTSLRDALRPPSMAFVHGFWEVRQTHELRHAPKTPQ